MLAYLLLNADRVQTREALAELLWPDQPGKQSRQNLRQTLSRVRRDLEAGRIEDPFRGDYQTIYLDVSRFAVDALRFGALLAACKTHPHRAVEHCPTCAEQLGQAVTLYKGDLLAGLGVEGSPAFEEWLLIQRESFHRQAVDALQTLIAYYRHLRDHARVRDLSMQLSSLEPYQESAYVYLIEALTLMGERATALVQYDRCMAMLTEELGVTPSERLGQIYAQLTQMDKPAPSREDLPRDLPKPGSRHHFPHFLVPFFGRHKEIAHLVERLADPNCRLFTVTGPGGIGKSRLLVEVAQRLNPLTYPDGLYFVPLAPIAEPEGLIRAIADAVAIPLVEGSPLQTQLMRGLSSLRLLLVLDNFEHLTDAVPLVMDMLEKAPGITCLVSSRQPLQLQAEWLLPLGGLNYPTEADDAQFEAYSAVAFFVDRARRAHADFKLTAVDRRAIVEICRLVGGMPLAITMAASWLSVHDCATIAAQIGNSLDFLAVPLRDLPSRHQSMRATFDVSWRLLPSSAQQTLARLSIFHDTFSHAAMQAIIQFSALDLARLVTHSLVMRVSADRYTLHELLRQFAAEKLDELRQTEAMRRAHAQYYLPLFASLEQDLVGTNQVQTLERLRVELPNLRAAWLAAGVDRQWHIIQQSLKSFERYWLATGGQAEGQSLLVAVAEHLTADLADYPSPNGANGAGNTLSWGQRRQLLARIKLAQSYFIHAYTPLQEAIDAAQIALSLTDGSDPISTDLVGEIHLALSWFYHHQGRRSQVEHHLNEAYVRLHQATDMALQSRLYLELSGLAGQKGDQTQRRAHLERAVALAEQSGDLTVDFTTRRYLTHMQMRWGDFSQMEHHSERLLHNARQAKNMLFEAQALNLLAGYYFYTGDFEKMAVYNAQAFPILEKLGSVQHLAIYFMRQGLHALFVGDLTRAIDIPHQCIDFARAYHHRDLEALASILLGRAQTKIGALDAGWQAFDQAMHILDQHGRSMDYLTAVLGQASILCVQDKAHAALERIAPYLPTILTGDLGIIVDYGHVYADAYRILHAAVDPRARDLLTRAHAVLTRVANTIPDADLRHSFWQNNPSHRFILAQQAYTLAHQ